MAYDCPWASSCVAVVAPSRGAGCGSDPRRVNGLVFVYLRIIRGGGEGGVTSGRWATSGALEPGPKLLLAAQISRDGDPFGC